MLATRHPAKIYVTGRNHAAAQQTIEDIKSSGATETEVEWIQCDHASLVSVKEAADQLLAKESRLDVLMANAGIMALPPGLVSEFQCFPSFDDEKSACFPIGSLCKSYSPGGVKWPNVLRWNMCNTMVF